jgi:hypothetical protein
MLILSIFLYRKSGKYFSRKTYISIFPLSLLVAPFSFAVENRVSVKEESRIFHLDIYKIFGITIRQVPESLVILSLGYWLIS